MMTQVVAVIVMVAMIHDDTTLSMLILSPKLYLWGVQMGCADIDDAKIPAFSFQEPKGLGFIERHHNVET